MATFCCRRCNPHNCHWHCTAPPILLQPPPITRLLCQTRAVQQLQFDISSLRRLFMCRMLQASRRPFGTAPAPPPLKHILIFFCCGLLKRVAAACNIISSSCCCCLPHSTSCFQTARTRLPRCSSARERCLRLLARVYTSAAAVAACTLCCFCCYCCCCYCCCCYCCLHDA